jgi:hypothetical protein
MADVRSSERTLPYALVRDDAVEGLVRTVFIRLQPPTDDENQWPADTLVADEAHVDVDAEGNVLGVTVFLR